MGALQLNANHFRFLIFEIPKQSTPLKEYADETSFTLFQKKYWSFTQRIIVSFKALELPFDEKNNKSDAFNKTDS